MSFNEEIRGKNVIVIGNSGGTDRKSLAPWLPLCASLISAYNANIASHPICPAPSMTVNVNRLTLGEC